MLFLSIIHNTNIVIINKQKKETELRNLYSLQ